MGARRSAVAIPPFGSGQFRVALTGEKGVESNVWVAIPPYRSGQFRAVLIVLAVALAIPSSQSLGTDQGSSEPCASV